MPEPRPDADAALRRDGPPPADDDPTTERDPVGDAQATVDRLIRDLRGGLSAEEAVYVVAVLANRSAAELHRLARAQAAATKGSPEWGTWAALQNGARRLVLDATSARESAAALVGRKR